MLCRYTDCNICADDDESCSLGLENLWRRVSSFICRPLTVDPRMTFEEMMAYPSSMPWPYFSWQIMPTIESPRASWVWRDLERYQFLLQQIQTSSQLSHRDIEKPGHSDPCVKNDIQVWAKVSMWTTLGLFTECGPNLTSARTLQKIQSLTVEYFYASNWYTIKIFI